MFFEAGQFVHNLRFLVSGMAGVFIVIIIIMLVVLLMNRLGRKK